MKHKKNIVIGGFLLAIILALATLGKDNSPTEQFSTSTYSLPEAQLSQIVELSNGAIFNLTASIVKKNINGNNVKMLAYNGSIPGPTLKIPQDSKITINFKNETDVETTLHPHGLRVENAFDGVPGLTQKEILPGESFTYELVFPDPGAFWYHPHIREDYAQELGLYGNFLVTPKNPNYWNTVSRETLLFLDDVLIEEEKIAPFYKKNADHTLMGRFGNIMFVNGQTDYTMTVKQGEVIRFYVTNSANTRPFRFTFNGAQMKLVGGDNGAYEKEEFKDAIILGPSERAIVEVLFAKPGEVTLENKTPDQTTKLGKIVVEEAPQPDPVAGAPDTTWSILHSNPAVIKSIDPFRAFFTKPLDKTISFSVDMGMGQANAENMSGGHTMPDGSIMGAEKNTKEQHEPTANGAMPNNMMAPIPKDGIEWEDNRMVAHVSAPSEVSWNIIDQETQQKNMDINWKFNVGDKVKIRIFNDPKSMHPMQHPIHFHGQRFLVLNKNGVAQNNLVWKDSVLVPSGQYVDILLDASNPGTWMAHCHIAEHLEAGMMFGFTVEK